MKVAQSPPTELLNMPPLAIDYDCISLQFVNEFFLKD